MSYKSNPCRNGCGTLIHFDDKIRSARGKAIPLEDDNEPHQCPNALPYTGQGPSVTAKASNPIQTIVNEPLDYASNHRDRRIKEAQEQRKAEHDELIAAMNALTVEIKALTTALQKKEFGVNSE